MIDENAPSCAWIGVEVSPMTAPVANSLGMAVPYGAIFDRPEAGSPAANAGIEAGDVITTINGSPLGSPRDFASTIATMAPGAIIYLSIYRNRQPMGVIRVPRD
jgi:serine protease Do